MGALFSKLCKGPVIVVDDKIENEDDKIYDIISMLRNNNLVVIKYSNLDDLRKEICNLLHVNFFIIDWNLIKRPKDEPLGVTPGDEAEVSSSEDVISIISELKLVSSAPIFILSALNKENIESTLKEANIVRRDNNYVFVESKQALSDNARLVAQIEKWIKQSPHVYLTKWWQNRILQKNTSIFWELYDTNSNWPSIFYESFKKDGEDPIRGLNDILFQLIKAKTQLDDIDHSSLKTQSQQANGEQIKQLYSQIMYMNDCIEEIKPGDIFELNGVYYINIRPACDTTKRTNQNKIELYLISGSEISDEEVKQYYDTNINIIRPKICNEILQFLHGKNFICFQFRDFQIKKYGEMKDHKICRLIPPFITSFQQRFITFLGRYGVPRVPDSIYKEIFKEENNGS